MRTLGAGTLILLGIIVFCVTLSNAVYRSLQPEEVEGAISSALTTSTSTAPAKLIIPSLSINANVQHVGIAHSGAIGIPQKFADVGWYKYGPVPGAPGNAIIDGHFDNAIGLPGVFNHLDRLALGDQIHVVSASGRTISFTVTKIESLSYNSSSTADIFRSSGTPGLVLITCSGAWEQSIRKYSKRLIIYSTLSKA